MDVTPSRHIIVGLATGQVGVIDMKNTNNIGVLGCHEAPICKVVWVEKFETVITFGFDNLAKVFSLKPQNNNNFQIG